MAGNRSDANTKGAGSRVSMGYTRWRKVSNSRDQSVPMCRSNATSCDPACGIGWLRRRVRRGSRSANCQAALHVFDVRHSALSEEAAHLAGRIFREYRKEGGPRTTILPDFLVAAHAALQPGSMATEDRGYLRACFLQIRILSREST